MAEHRIVYLTQPVTAAADRSRELYRECLARIVDPDGCMHGPMTFVPQLEACGAIHLLDQHMVRLALEHLSRSDSIMLGCNISADTIQDVRHWEPISDLLRKHPHCASRLVIELTETRPIDNLDLLIQHIAEARALGCRIAIDDFGEGYLSPAVLLRLHVDIVKIDASMLRTIRSTADRHSTLEHIVGFASCIAANVVVEGVEDAEDLDRAMIAGATHVQGYYIGRPAPTPVPSTVIRRMSAPAMA